MATGKALWSNAAGLKMGQARFGFHGEHAGSVKQIVHDGDTVNVNLFNNLGVRFLGIDTPEVSFQFPGSSNFVALSNPKWDQLFTSGQWREGLSLDPGLLLNLAQRIGDGHGVAQNHATLADEGQKALEAIMQADLDKSGKTKEDFALFMAFAHEFLDSYGRLLCYLNSGIENFEDPATADTIKRFSYNERQLSNGAAVPYFIWPNIQPFMGKRPFDRENIEPIGFWKLIRGAGKLRAARKAVETARNAGLGIYNPANPLRVMPFELRFLSRKKGPDRFVIDLSNEGSNLLLKPENYYTIENPEDRLHIPPEYLPIFQAYGWELEV